MSNFGHVQAAAAPLLIQGDDAGEFARTLLAGLSATPKHIPCKYFYDAEGSALFERICELPEYYVTRTELDLLAREAVHSENSHKYTVDGFRALAAKAGFTPRAVWSDPARMFSLHWLDADCSHVVLIST